MTDTLLGASIALGIILVAVVGGLAIRKVAGQRQMRDWRQNLSEADRQRTRPHDRGRVETSPAAQPECADGQVHSVSMVGSYINFYREADCGVVEIEGRESGRREWVVIDISKTRSVRDADTGLFSVEALEDTKCVMLHRENYGQEEVIEELVLKTGDYAEFRQSRLAYRFDSPRFSGEIAWSD